MPLANLRSIHVEWVPDGAARLILTSKVGNIIPILVVEETTEMRAAIGRYVTATPLDRWLTDATRTALQLGHRQS